MAPEPLDTRGWAERDELKPLEYLDCERQPGACLNDHSSLDEEPEEPEDDSLNDIPSRVEFPAADIPPEVTRFAKQNLLDPTLDKALKLVLRHFPASTGRRVSLECDMETGDEYLVIAIDISGQPQEILGCYRGYVRDLITSIPEPNRSKIRLAYNVT